MSGELVVAVADFLAHKRALGRKYRAEVRHSAIPFSFTTHPSGRPSKASGITGISTHLRSLRQSCGQPHKPSRSTVLCSSSPSAASAEDAPIIPSPSVPDRAGGPSPTAGTGSVSLASPGIGGRHGRGPLRPDRQPHQQNQTDRRGRGVPRWRPLRTPYGSFGWRPRP